MYTYSPSLFIFIPWGMIGVWVPRCVHCPLGGVLCQCRGLCITKRVWVPCCDHCLVNIALHYCRGVGATLCPLPCGQGSVALQGSIAARTGTWVSLESASLLPHRWLNSLVLCGIFHSLKSPLIISPSASDKWTTTLRSGILLWSIFYGLYC
jgi:hypothetical protein